MYKFGVIGLGFIFERHLEAIESIGGKIIIGCDIDESKKDKLPDDVLFTDDWRKIRGVDYVVILTPNSLHWPMINYFAKQGIKILVEKPPVISTDELLTLRNYDNIYTVLQLRHHPMIFQWKQQVYKNREYEVEMKILVHRDEWYFRSWKNDKRRSGGLLFNIGIHYFDILVYLFGKPIRAELLEGNEKQAAGYIYFKNAVVDWELCLTAPMDNQQRYIIINGKKLDLSRKFENLHTKVYENLLKGDGVNIKDCEITIKLIESLKYE